MRPPSWHSSIQMLAAFLGVCISLTSGCAARVCADETGARAGGVRPPWITSAAVRPDGGAVAVIVAKAVQSSGSERHGSNVPSPPGRYSRTLWVVDRLSGATRKLVTGIAPMTGVSWRKTGDQVVFADQYWEVVIADAATGAAVKTIPPDPERSMYMWPAWSPNGTAIAFQANLFDDDETRRALMVTSPGDSPQVVSDDLAEPLGWCWSPDSARLLYVPGGRGSRYRHNMGQALVPPWQGSTEVLRWSPDGNWLAAIVTPTDALAFSLVVADRSLRSVVFSLPTTSRALAWSPDSRVLLVSGKGQDGSAGWPVAVYPADWRTVQLSGEGLRGAVPVGWAGDTALLLNADRSELLGATEGGVVRQVADIGVDGVVHGAPTRSGEEAHPDSQALLGQLLEHRALSLPELEKAVGISLPRGTQLLNAQRIAWQEDTIYAKLRMNEAAKDKLVASPRFTRFSDDYRHEVSSGLGWPGVSWMSWWDPDTVHHFLASEGTIQTGAGPKETRVLISYDSAQEQVYIVYIYWVHLRH
jgi:hypothetical protein